LIDMSKPIALRAPKGKSLDQQKADFTSEGSPPPGKVDIAVPEMPDKTSKPEEHTSDTVHGIRKRKSSLKDR